MKRRSSPNLCASFAPTAYTIASAGAAVFSGFVSLTSRVMRAQFSPLREALKEANGGGLEVLHDVRRGLRRGGWQWMDDATPSCSPVSASREGGLLAMRGRAVPVKLNRYDSSECWHGRMKCANVWGLTPHLLSGVGPSFWTRGTAATEDEVGEES